jgi:hypothetical protein
VRTLSGRIAPGLDLTRELMRTLADAKLITVDPGAAIVGDSTDLRHYLTLYFAYLILNFDAVHWRLALGVDGKENHRYLDGLMDLATTRRSFDGQGEELADIWFEAILDECAPLP